MVRIVFLIIAVIMPSFISCQARRPGRHGGGRGGGAFTAGSLTCNKCSVGLVGFCLNSAEETCSTNTSLCFTAKATFPTISTFLGFSTQGCREADGCASTTNGTLLGALYEVKSDCCSTTKCNPVQLSGAPSARLSLTAALGAAVVASVWGSVWF